MGKETYFCGKRDLLYGKRDLFMQLTGIPVAREDFDLYPYVVAAYTFTLSVYPYTRMMPNGFCEILYPITSWVFFCGNVLRERAGERERERGEGGAGFIDCL